MGMGCREWGFGSRESGIGIGVGIGIGIENQEPSADSREWGMGIRDSGMGNGDWGLGNHVDKRGCEKMVIIFSQPFFIYPISW